MPDETPLPDPLEPEGAEVRQLPVLAEPRVIESRNEVAILPAVAAATGGFLLAIITFVLVRILRRPKSAATFKFGGGGRSKKSEIAASRSFLVDVHLLKDR